MVAVTRRQYSAFEYLSYGTEPTLVPSRDRVKQTDPPVPREYLTVVSESRTPNIWIVVLHLFLTLRLPEATKDRYYFDIVREAMHQPLYVIHPCMLSRLFGLELLPLCCGPSEQG